MDEKTISNRENCMNFLRRLAESGAESVVVAYKIGDNINASWVADTMEGFAMATLLKQSLFQVMTGSAQAQEYEIDEDDEIDWEKNIN